MGERQYRWYNCHRCGRQVNDYEAFGVGDYSRWPWVKRRTYCLRHIPRWAKVRMWLRETPTTARYHLWYRWRRQQ